jgi:hypothetical protein
MLITVGQTPDADLCGTTNAAMQAALDYVAARGGGEVRVGPGVYTLWDAVRVPSHTRLVGAGAETVLRKADGWKALLYEDGDFYDDWFCCNPLPPLQPGQGVVIESNAYSGFFATVGTVQEVQDNRARINRRFSADFMVAHDAFVATVHPLVSVEDSCDVAIRNFVIDGNGANNPRMNGCRGAAVYGLFGHGVHVSGVTVRNFHGDAISFQHSHEWVVEDCLFEDNLGGGMHPGSGSKRPVLRRCTSRRNRGWGLFVCWRVKGARYEDNVLEANGAGGISIGHKDTDNLFLRNRVVGNAGPGISTRDETFPMAPHRGVYQENIVTGNNAGGAQVVLTGAVHDLRFTGNIFDPTETAFDVGPGVVNLIVDESAVV